MNASIRINGVDGPYTQSAVQKLVEAEMSLIERKRCDCERIGVHDESLHVREDLLRSVRFENGYAEFRVTGADDAVKSACHHLNFVANRAMFSTQERIQGG